MTGRRRNGFSRIEPGALIGLAVLALAYWGTVATLIMARNTSTAVVELGPTTIRPAEPPPRAIRTAPVRPWCFGEAFNVRGYSPYGRPRPIGLALHPPCMLPVSRLSQPDYPASYGVLLAN
jgi:hypothetical protein